MKKPLFIVLTLVFFLPSLATATQKSADDLQTPHRSGVASSVEPTPGQQLCSRQASTLTRDKFVAVLDPQIVDSWGVKWSVFLDPSFSFDDPQKRQSIRFIVNKMKYMNCTKSDGAPRSLYLEILGLQGDAEGIHAQRLDILALNYFKEIFSLANLTPEMKLGGVQLGGRIIVNQGQPDEILYHVKTHAAGRLSSNSTAAKTINPNELLAYRVLEHLGIGCEAHFFQRSAEDVYIATLDAGMGGCFSVFESVTGSKYVQPNEDLGKRVAGSLMDISNDPRQLNFENIEKNTSHDLIAQNFIQQMAQLDIVTRVLRLHDLLNNSGNWGFVEAAQQYPAIRVIDFRVIDDPKLAMDNENWGSFLEGNGLYQYAGSHKILRYVIHDRPRPSRVETARRIFDSGLKENFQKAARLAYRDMLNYIAQPVFQEQHDSLRQSLKRYYQATQSNIEFFSGKLRDWIPENEKRERGEEFGRQQQQRQPTAER